MTGRINTHIKYLAGGGRIAGRHLANIGKSLENDGAIVQVDREGIVEITFPETGEPVRTYLPIR
jgi:hypothetical protein